MTDHKQITQFYAAATKAVGAAETSGADKAAALLDAATGVFDHLEEYAPFIVSFAVENKINISGKLAELESLTAAAKARAQKEKAAGAATESVNMLLAVAQEYKKNLDLGHTPEEKEMTAAAGQMEKAMAALAAPKEQSRFISFNEYIADCKTYDPDKDFTPALFNIPFPDGTVSYIGARTSRGKTASMLNLAREVITAENPRRVFFVTLEMSRRQLLTRLALSLVYAKWAKDGPSNIKALKEQTRPMRDYYRIVKGKDITDQGGGYQITTGVKAALETIQKSLDGKMLVMYDARGAGLKRIINAIRANAEKGSLVLLDYIQRMPSPDNISDSTYMRVKGISDKVLNVAAATDAVIIAGAQFTRPTKEQKAANKERDVFDDASFRESGDLEQDAHCAVGLGWWNADKENRFFEVLKVRDGDIPKHPYRLVWNGAFQYMANSGKEATKEIPPDDAPEGEGKPVQVGTFRK
jgi:replicative DNA helicase